MMAVKYLNLQFKELQKTMYIVHISSECAPVAKVGGLGDVVYGLSRELEVRGNDVEIMLPKYDVMRHDQVYELHEVMHDLWVPYYEKWFHCSVFFHFLRVFLTGAGHDENAGSSRITEENPIPIALDRDANFIQMSRKLSGRR